MTGKLLAALAAQLPPPGAAILLSILLGAVAGFGAWELFRGLRSGRMSTFGTILPPYSRAAQPILFWMNAALNALQLFIFGSLVLYVVATWRR